MAGERTVRSRILAAVLPRDGCARVSTGSGEGNLCVCCDKPVARGEPQFNVEGQLDGQPRWMPMHEPCFHLWRASVDGIDGEGAGKQP
ncbi:MAG: hypothetical protein WB646_07285 [Steroidobacteraceae bacterium]